MPKNMPDSSQIKEGYGVIVVGLHSNIGDNESNPLLADLKLRYILKGESYGFKVMTFKGDEYIHLIQIPEGRYRFVDLTLGESNLKFSPDF